MHTTESVFKFLRDLIVEMKDSEPDDIGTQTTIDDLGLDSLDYVEIQVGVKRQFGVALAPTLFERQIKTIGELCDYIAGAETNLEKTS
jgi:acyl carrier protein